MSKLRTIRILAIGAALATSALAAANYRILQAFSGGADGGGLWGSLILDSHGHLYGTTLWGGPAGDTVGGLAFEFTP